MAEMVKCRVNGEHDIILPKHRADRPEWFLPQGWEKPRLSAMHKVITERVRAGLPCTVYYVGSEEGDMCGLCSMWGAEILMFEPNALVWPNIRAIWEANGLKRPLLAYYGFASHETNESPARPEHQIGMQDGWPICAFGPVIGDHAFRSLSDQSHMAPQIRIDDVVARGYPPPDVLTFDVEGAEWQVCRGAEKTLRDHRPVVFASIHPEFMYEQWKQYCTDFRKWIRDIGYTETFLDYYHELHTMYLPT